MSNQPRAYTEDEARDIFLTHVRGLAEYWASLENKTNRERCDGLAFSIMAVLDGSAINIPAMAVLMLPHPSDSEYHAKHGENWFEAGTDIGGCLHELYHTVGEPKSAVRQVSTEHGEAKKGCCRKDKGSCSGSCGNHKPGHPRF